MTNLDENEQAIDPDLIAALDDEAFRGLVTQHIHPVHGNAQLWDALTTPQLIERTRDLISLMRRQVQQSVSRRESEAGDYQIQCLERGVAGRADWLKHRAELRKWKVKAAGFRQALEQRAIFVKSRRKVNTVSRVSDDLNHHYRVVQALALAIRDHQAANAVTGSGEQHDHELWRLLDELTLPVGADRQRTTLRNMLRTYWLEAWSLQRKEAERADAERLMRSAPGGRGPTYHGIAKVRAAEDRKRLA